MQDILFYGYAEDEVSCAVMNRLFNHHNESGSIRRQIKFETGFPYNMKGNSNLKKLIPKLKGMNKNPNFHVFILTDLDKVDCAPDLIREWFPVKYQLSRNMVFRVAVREVEAWLPASRLGLAKFLGMSAANFTDEPDSLEAPKAHLLKVIRSKARKSIHKNMLPSGNAHIGPEYNPVMCDFVMNHWDIDIAKRKSDSLQRAIRALQQI